MSNLPDYVKRKRDFYKLGKTPQESAAYYQKIANVYEDDATKIEFNMHKSVAKLLLKVMSIGKYGIEKNARILDVGSGTGLLGELLRAEGFVGQIDGVDGSSAMLEISKSKEGVYNRTFCHIIEPDTKMPEELTKEDYDIVICSGGILPNFIHYKSMKHLLKALKTGGLILFALVRRKSSSSLLEFNIGFAREEFRLESEGIWKLIDLLYNPRVVKKPEQLVDEVETCAIEYCYLKLTSMPDSQ